MNGMATMQSNTSTQNAQNKEKKMSTKPNIMVSTSVYGFKRDIVQIRALLKELGYDVWNSHFGTLES